MPGQRATLYNILSSHLSSKSVCGSNLKTNNCVDRPVGRNGARGLVIHLTWVPGVPQGSAGAQRREPPVRTTPAFKLLRGFV